MNANLNPEPYSTMVLEITLWNEGGEEGLIAKILNDNRVMFVKRLDQD